MSPIIDSSSRSSKAKTQAVWQFGQVAEAATGYTKCGSTFLSSQSTTASTDRRCIASSSLGCRRKHYRRDPQSWGDRIS
jgi:hypothetical protein